MVASHAQACCYIDAHAALSQQRCVDAQAAHEQEPIAMDFALTKPGTYIFGPELLHQSWLILVFLVIRSSWCFTVHNFCAAVSMLKCAYASNQLCKQQLALLLCEVSKYSAQLLTSDVSCFKADMQSAYTCSGAAVRSAMADKGLGWCAGVVRLFVVVDTSVLLSHWSFIQALHRNLGEDGAVAAEQAGTPGVQVLLVVPWTVLVELDKLKAEHSVLRIPGLSCLPTCSGLHLYTC